MLKGYVWVTAIIATGQIAGYIIHFKAYSPSRFKELFVFALDFLFAAPYGVTVYFSFLAAVIFVLSYSVYARRLRSIDTADTLRPRQRSTKYVGFILLDVGLYALSFVGTLLLLRFAFAVSRSVL